MEITTALIKELREKTGAGILDCKSALTETQGDVSEAEKLLRKKGLAAAAKKSGRTASEGLIGYEVTNDRAALVELNSETDFVAKLDDFGKARQALAHLVYTSDALGDTTNGDGERLKAMPASSDFPGASGGTVGEW